MINDIETEFKELVKRLEMDERMVDYDNLTLDDIKGWGYDSWDSFLESII